MVVSMSNVLPLYYNLFNFLALFIVAVSVVVGAVWEAIG